MMTHDPHVCAQDSCRGVDVVTGQLDDGWKECLQSPEFSKDADID